MATDNLIPFAVLGVLALVGLARGGNGNGSNGGNGNGGPAAFELITPTIQLMTHTKTFNIQVNVKNNTGQPIDFSCRGSMWQSGVELVSRVDWFGPAGLGPGGVAPYFFVPDIPYPEETNLFNPPVLMRFEFFESTTLEVLAVFEGDTS